MAIKGHVPEVECRLLYDLASEIKIGCIVEIGSYRGRSTSALAFGIWASGTAIPIYAIEPHESFQGVLGGLFGPQDRAAFFRNMSKNPEICEWVHLVNLSSEYVVSRWPLEVSLLWIDGDHTYDGVRRDFDCWERYLRKGGLAVFHDSTDSRLGPHRLIGEIMRQENYLQVEQIASTTVLKKIV